MSDMSTDHSVPKAKPRSNGKIALACMAFVFGMVGVAYAAVPLYDLFCRVTGYGGTTQQVTQYSNTVLDQEITIRLDSNVSGDLPWEFKPQTRSVTLPIGETAQVFYAAENTSPDPALGTATFNVTPQSAGAYFMKVECFCFTETELESGESMDMPVVFYVDPAIVDVPELKNTNTITLSYTFHPVRSGQPTASADKARESAGGADTEFGG